MSRIAFFATPLVVGAALMPQAGLAGPNQNLPTTEASSLVRVDCSTCPPIKDEAKTGAYVVQELEPGTQKVEIREINGKKKMVRTEAWLGGSPVVFITAMPEENAKDLDAAAAAQPMPGAETPAVIPAAAVPASVTGEEPLPEAKAEDPAATYAKPEQKAEVPAVEPPAAIDSNTTSAVEPEPALPAFDPDSLQLRQ